MQTSLLRFALVAACLSTGLVRSAAAQSIDAGIVSTDAGAPDATTVFGPWTREGLPPVPPRAPFELPDDDSLQFIIRDGSGGWSYLECGPEAAGESAEAEGDALPVGGDRALACRTYDSPVVSEQLLQGEDGRLFCWKGAGTQYRTVADARLRVRVTETSPSAPWSLRVTADEPFVMQRVASSIGTIWPLWLEVYYQTVDFAPAVDARCDGVFR